MHALTYAHDLGEAWEQGYVHDVRSLGMYIGHI